MALNTWSSRPAGMGIWGRRSEITSSRSPCLAANNLGLSKALPGIAGGNKLMRDPSFEPGIGDRLGNSLVVELLAGIQFVPARIPRRVVVGNPLTMISNGPDHIPFHDLHVIDVVQQTDPG